MWNFQLSGRKSLFSTRLYTSAAFWRRYFLIKYIRGASDGRKGHSDNGQKLKGTILQSFKQIEARRSWLVLLASLLIGGGVNNTSLAMFKLERTIMALDYTRPVWTTLYEVCFRHSNGSCVVFWKIFSLPLYKFTSDGKIQRTFYESPNRLFLFQFTIL